MTGEPAFKASEPNLEQFSPAWQEEITACAGRNPAGALCSEDEPCQVAVFSGKLPSMEAEIDCKLQSNSR